MKVKQANSFQQAIILFVFKQQGLSFLANETELMVLWFEVNKNMYRDRMLHSLHISTAHVFVTVTLCGCVTYFLSVC